MIGLNRRKRGARGVPGPSELVFSANTVTNSATIRYLPFGYTLGTAPTAAPAFALNTARNFTLMRFATRVAGVGAGSVIYTLRKNGVNTGLVITTLATATTATFLLPVGVVFASGDNYDVEVTKTGTVNTGPTDVSITIS